MSARQAVPDRDVSTATTTTSTTSSTTTTGTSRHAHSLHQPGKTDPTSTRPNGSSSASFKAGTVPASSDLRPRTAPSQSQPKSPPPFDPPIPKIAIFADALSLKKLREQYQTLRKSSTEPDLTHTELRRPYARRIHSSSASSSKSNNTASARSTPQLPELNLGELKASLSAKRPPASRSSHGVETSFGPPPALATRSSYSSDIARRAQSPAAATFAQQKIKPYNLTSPAQDEQKSARSPFEGSFRDLSTASSSPPISPGTLPTESSPDALDAMVDHQSTYSDAREYLDDTPSKNMGGRSTGQDIMSGADTEGSSQSAEDLFLNLAQDSPPPARENNSQDYLERRLSSRGKGSAHERTSFSLSFSASKSRRDSIGSHASGAQSSGPRAESSFNTQRRASATSASMMSNLSPRNLSSLPTDQRFNAYRNRYAASSSPQQTARRPPGTDTQSVYTRSAVYRPSRLNQFSTRDFDASSNADLPLEDHPFRIRAAHVEVAESVVSGAPSTVWDELQELKSRIQKMEVNEKMASGGSNGSGERPKTATTTLTSTMSSSPKHTFKTSRSPTDSVIDHTISSTYPTLHHALERCKTILNPSLYRSLEIAASDAIEMALLTGNSAPANGQMFSGAASVINGGMTTERHLKGKADNVVRNLQDLCIALCDAKNDVAGPSSRPGTSGQLPSRDAHAAASAEPQRTSMVRASSRATSNEPETNSDTSRPIASRALDRIEARRASLMSAGNLSATNSPQAAEAPQRLSLQFPSSVEGSSPQVLSKVPRSGTSLLRSRRREGTAEPEEHDLRPVSRAATEIGNLRKRQDRFSGSFATSRFPRDYTSTIPLPDSSPVAPTASTPTTTPSVRRLNGPSLRRESPRSASVASSLLREPRRAKTELEKSPEPETPTQDEDSGGRRLFRRSLGLYTSSARSSLGLGSLSRKGDRRSLAPSTTASTANDAD